MKVTLEAKNGTSLVIDGKSAALDSSTVAFLGSDIGPTNIEHLHADLTEIMASKEYKVWAVPPAAKRKATRKPKLDKSVKRRPGRPRKTTQSPVNGSAANGETQPHSLTMAEQEDLAEQAAEHNRGFGTPPLAGEQVKTKLRRGRPRKVRPTVAGEAAAG